MEIEQDRLERNMGTETPLVEKRSNKVFRYLFLVLYFITIVPYVFLFTVATMSPVFTLVVLVVVIALPFYLNFKNKKRLEIPELERSKITKKNSKVALVFAALILFYMIYSLYRDGGSLGALFY